MEENKKRLDIGSIDLPHLDEIQSFLEKEMRYVEYELERYVKNTYSYERVDQYKKLIDFLYSQLKESYSYTRQFITLALRGEQFKDVTLEKGYDSLGYETSGFIDYISVRYVDSLELDFEIVSYRNYLYDMDDTVELNLDGIILTPDSDTDEKVLGFMDNTTNSFKLSFIENDNNFRTALKESPLLLYIETYKIKSFLDTLNLFDVKGKLKYFENENFIFYYEENLVDNLEIDKDMVFLMNQRFSLNRIRNVLMLSQTLLEKQEFMFFELPDIIDRTNTFIGLINRIEVFSNYMSRFKNSTFYDEIVNKKYVFVDTETLISFALHSNFHDLFIHILDVIYSIYYIPYHLEIFGLDTLEKSVDFTEDKEKFYNVLPHNIFIKDLSTLTRTNLNLLNHKKIKNNYVFPLFYLRLDNSLETENILYALLELKKKYPKLESVYLITKEGRYISTKDKKIYSNENKEDYITDKDSIFYQVLNYDEIVSIQYNKTIIDLQ